MKIRGKSAGVLTLVLGLAILALPVAGAQVQGGKAPATQPSAVAATKNGFVTTADGIQIHYIEAGRTRTTGNFRFGGPPKEGEVRAGKMVISKMRQEPALLFVPGWTMPGEIWEKQIEYFSKNYHVVAMDPRSQGQSTKATEGHFPAARARDIKAVVDQLKLAPVVLVGWSMGVPEAAAYVDQFGTDTLAGLVLVDGFVGGDYSVDIYRAFLNILNNMQVDRRKAADTFVRSMYRTPQTEEYIKRVVEASLVTPTNSAVALIAGILGADYRPALAKIDKPALIVVAGGGPRQALYQDMHGRIPSSQLEIFDKVGHALFVDDAPRFNSLLEDFLKGLSQPANSAR